MPPAAAPALPRLLLISAAAALAYTLIGWASLTLALPPGHAAPIFPAAGLALALVLAYGARLAPAVLVGSVAVGALPGLIEGHGLLAALRVALPIGAGAALQALLGAALVRRHVGPAPTLDSPLAIARFFGYGGALACLVSASLAVLVLWFNGRVPADALALTWLTWWAGDTLGVVIAAPVALSLFGTPREAWRPRRHAVALPLVCATLLLALGIGQIARWQMQRSDARFERDAQTASRTLELRLQAHLDALEALHGVYIASSEVDADEFRRASAVWLGKLPSVQALGWHERIARADLPAFEAAVQATGEPGFRVFDRDAALAAADTEVVAMRYVEPRHGNEAAIGVNALSIAPAREAIERARRSGAPAASAAFRLTQETDRQVGVVIYRAVPASMPDTLRGLVFLTLRMDDALAALRSGLPAYLQVCLLDTDPAASIRRLAGPPDCEAEGGAEVPTQLAAVQFGGRPWALKVRAPGGVPAEAGGPLAGDAGTGWLFAITGLMAIGLMGALLLIVTGRTRRTELAVAERTFQLQHEIAEREATEHALRDSEQRFRNIFNSVPMGVLYTDLQGGIKQTNKVFVAMSGYPEVDLLRSSTASMMHPDDVEEDRRTRERLAQGELAVARRRERLLTRDGRVLWVDVTMTLLRDAAGAPFRLVALVEDMSEHLRLEEAERARERAEASNRAKSDFLSRMSHELRTPLNAMLGFAQLLELDRAPRLDARHGEWVGQIRSAGWHLLEMINDVLDLSRIESGTLKLQIEPLRLAPLLDESLALVEPQARARRVALERGADEGAALRVLGDATRIKQILTNLLSNAVKYNREDGRVLVTMRRTAAPDGTPRAEVDVADTGLGMNTEQLARLFEPFNRLGRERGGAEGTGIGLVIARLLAERLGGSLAVASREGEGSVFTLTLPPAPDDTAATKPAPLDDTSYGYHRRRVLYIEDNEINVEVMRGMLAQRPQVQLAVAMTGLEGLAAVRTEPPDLILLDMHLPDISGLELLHHLQADEAAAAIPVVVVSADALPAQIATALNAGATRYLTKPVAVDEMLGTIDELLTAMTTRFS